MMATLKNYYQVLELDLFADSESVKGAFRKLARLYHPDLNEGKRDAEEKFKAINEAYEILGDTDRKDRYDKTLSLLLNKPLKTNTKTVKDAYQTSQSDSKNNSQKSAGREKIEREKIEEEDGKGTPNSSTPISEFFETFKKGFSPSSPSNKGHDSKAEKPEKTSKSAQPKISTDPPKGSQSKIFQTHEKPSTGEKKKRGEDVTIEALITPSEGEHGTVKTVNVQHNEVCKRCSGTGRVNGLLCNGCQGEKILVRLKKIDVRIPGGVKQGSKVRIAKEGARGVNGGENGDLFLLIKIAMDPGLKVEGLNVYSDLPLQVTEAVLGTELEIATMHGRVKMTIPPLTPVGKVFRLKEQGVHSGGHKGDQFVTVQIVLPETLSVKEKELYQELAKIRKQASS